MGRDEQRRLGRMVEGRHEPHRRGQWREHLNLSEKSHPLSRYVRSLSMLRQDLEKSMHWNMYKGLGKTAAKSYEAIHTHIAKMLNDPYIDSLTLELDADTNDKEIAFHVMLISGQLLSYVMGEIEAESTTEDLPEEE